MALSLIPDGTVYTWSGSVKLYESSLFSYSSNFSKHAPIESISSDGTYMDYMLPFFTKYKSTTDTTASYYYSVHYGPLLGTKATKTWYYTFMNSSGDLTDKQYYLHITGYVFKRAYYNPSSSTFYVAINISINQNATQANGISIMIDGTKLDTSLDISVGGQFRESTISSYLLVSGNVNIPSNYNSSIELNSKYLLDINCRSDTDGNYTDTSFNSSSNYGSNFRTNCSTTSVNVTQSNGTQINCIVVLHNHP